MKKVSILFIFVMLFTMSAVFAEPNQAFYDVVLNDNVTTVNGENISTDLTKDIYWSENMNNGGTSDEAIVANVKVDFESSSPFIMTITGNDS